MRICMNEGGRLISFSIWIESNLSYVFFPLSSLRKKLLVTFYCEKIFVKKYCEYSEPSE